MQITQAQLGSDPGCWHASLNTPHKDFFSFLTVTCEYHPTVRSWLRKPRQMASQTLPHPKGFKSLCFCGNLSAFPAGNREEHDIYHVILPWLHPMTAKVSPLFPTKGKRAEASFIASMSCFHFTPSHSPSSSLSTVSPALYKHFKTHLILIHQVHSNARIGQGYQQEVSNPAPDV